MSFTEELSSAQKLVNDALERCFVNSTDHKTLCDAMRYSLLAGGKRLRPVLLIKFCEAVGGKAEDAVDAACGIEMLHTYSLIHDDLPCMDDDDLRRGKPTNHKVYGETTAVLAGDALQAAAFEYVLSGDVCSERKTKMALTLAKAAGEAGMCGGQYLDTVNEGQQLSEEQLLCVHSLKTGALLRAACLMGVQCGGGDAGHCAAAEAYAENLGLAFQIRDDMLDVISTNETLGKNIGSDAQSGKNTFVSLMGIEKCGDEVRKYTKRAQNALSGTFSRPEFLCELAESLVSRMF